MRREDYTTGPHKVVSVCLSRLTGTLGPTSSSRKARPAFVFMFYSSHTSSGEGTTVVVHLPSDPTSFLALERGYHPVDDPQPTPSFWDSVCFLSGVEMFFVFQSALKWFCNSSSYFRIHPRTVKPVTMKSMLSYHDQGKVSSVIYSVGVFFFLYIFG